MADHASVQGDQPRSSPESDDGDVDDTTYLESTSGQEPPLAGHPLVTRIANRSDVNEVLAQSRKLLLRLTDVVERSHGFGKLHDVVFLLIGKLSLLRSILSKAETACLSLGEPASAVDIEAESFNQIVGTLGTTLMDCSDFCSRLFWNHKYEQGVPTAAVLSRYQRITKRVFQHYLRLHHLLPPLEIDLLVRMRQLAKTNQPVSALLLDSLEGLELDRDEELSKHRVTHSPPLEPLPIPQGIKNVLNHVVTDTSTTGLGKYTLRLVDALDDVKEPVKDQSVQFTKLMACVCLYTKVAECLAAVDLPPTSHWPSYVKALKQKLDHACGWEGLHHQHPFPTIDVSSIQEDVLQQFGLGDQIDFMRQSIKADADDKATTGQQQTDTDENAPPEFRRIYHCPLQRFGSFFDGEIELCRQITTSGPISYRLQISDYGREQTVVFRLDDTSIAPQRDNDGVMTAGLLLRNHSGTVNIPLPTRRETLKFQHALTGYKLWSSYYDKDVQVKLCRSGLTDRIAKKACLQLWFYSPLDDDPASDSTPDAVAASTTHPSPKLVLFIKDEHNLACVSMDLNDNIIVNPRRCDCSREGEARSLCRVASIGTRVKSHSRLFGNEFWPARSETWDITRIGNRTGSTIFRDLEWIDITFSSADKRTQFAGTLNPCQCEHLPPPPQQQLSDVVLQCVLNGHRGMLGELQAYGNRHQDKYFETRGILEYIASRENFEKSSDTFSPEKRLQKVLNNIHERQYAMKEHVGRNIKELRNGVILDRAFSNPMRDGSSLTKFQTEARRQSLDRLDESLQPLLTLLARNTPWKDGDNDELVYKNSKTYVLPASSHRSNPDLLPAGTVKRLFNLSLTVYILHEERQVMVLRESIELVHRALKIRRTMMKASQLVASKLLDELDSILSELVYDYENVINGREIATPFHEPLAVSSNHKDQELVSSPKSVADSTQTGMTSVGDSGYGTYEYTSQKADHVTSTTTTIPEEDNANANDNDDAATVYSIESVMPTSRDMYISEFSQRLIDDIQQLFETEDVASFVLPPALPELLKSFARRLHAESLSKVEREASVFLHKHRGTIADALHVISSDGENGASGSEDDDLGSVQSEESSADDNDKLHLPFRKSDALVTEWMVSLLPEIDGPPVPTDDIDHFDSSTKSDLPNMAAYQQFVNQSTAYQWLLSTIRGSWQLNTPGPVNAMKDMSEAIASQLLIQPTFSKVSRRSSPPNIEMSLSLDWDLRNFIKNQEYSIPEEEVLHRVICLTGTQSEAHAVTPLDYLKQTWPLTYRPIYDILKRFLASTTNICDYTSPSGQYLLCEQKGTSFSLTIRGKLDFVLETTEQVGWLASALRPSPGDEGVVTCRPYVNNIQIGKGKEKASPDNAVSTSCELTFFFERLPSRTDEAVSQVAFCWASMFRNPILVTGYPISQRTAHDTGLEVSLKFMALLMGSSEIFQLGENIILKGFCSLLVAVEASKNTVLWHLLFNPSGERISFCDERIDQLRKSSVSELSLRQLESCRHVVGWCGDVREYSGHPDANWTILSSSLHEPPRSFVIDRLYADAGSQLIGGLAGALGVRDKPVYFPREKSYSGLIDWVSSQPIVLYDVEDRRAWLTDGASALLHLVRASIAQDRLKPVYRAKWKFDGKLEGDDNESQEETLPGAETSIMALSSVSNLNKPLYLDDIRPTSNGQMEEVHYYFRDRVQEILHYLQVLIDHQAQVAAQDGYWIRSTGKIGNKSVIGFDFWDIAKPPGPVRPRVYNLQAGGHGWIDYIRSIRATTLFGRNFGELVQATSPDMLCPEWRAVPKGAEYLSVAVSTLKAIHTARNEAVLNPGEITSDILWSSRLELFSRCGYTTMSAASSSSASPRHIHHDPVQLLLPKGRRFHLDIPKVHSNITLGTLGNEGAVLFGHTPYKGQRTSRQDSKSHNSVENQSDDISIVTASSRTDTTSKSVSTTVGAGTEVTSISSTTTTAVAKDEAPGSTEGQGKGGRKESILRKLGFSRRGR